MIDILEIKNIKQTRKKLPYSSFNYENEFDIEIEMFALHVLCRR